MHDDTIELKASKASDLRTRYADLVTFFTRELIEVIVATNGYLSACREAREQYLLDLQTNDPTAVGRPVSDTDPFVYAICHGLVAGGVPLTQKVMEEVQRELGLNTAP